MQITISHVLNSRIATSEADALKVRCLVIDAARQGPVSVSFHGIDIMVVHFLHVLVGTMYSPEHKHLVENITYVDMRNDQRIVLDKVIANAIEWYGKPEEERGL